MPKIQSRQKGSRYELDIAKYLSNEFGLRYGIDIRRTPNSGALITRSDLWISSKFRNILPFFIEAKNRQSWSFDKYHSKAEWPPYTWFKEAEEKLHVDPDYDQSSRVMLIFTKKYAPSYVMVRSSAPLREKYFSFCIYDASKGIFIFLFDEFFKKWKNTISPPKDKDEDSE